MNTDRSTLSYFHDGQNVLYSKESFSGYSRCIQQSNVILMFPRMIVVAIDNDGPDV